MSTDNQLHNQEHILLKCRSEYNNLQENTFDKACKNGGYFVEFTV